jgi:hypothetical protein
MTKATVDPSPSAASGSSNRLTSVYHRPSAMLIGANRDNLVLVTSSEWREMTDQTGAAGYLVARRAPWRPRRSAEARPRHRRRRRGAAPSRPGRSNRNFQPSREAGAKFLPGERQTPRPVRIKPSAISLARRDGSPIAVVGSAIRNVGRFDRCCRRLKCLGTHDKCGGPDGMLGHLAALLGPHSIGLYKSRLEIAHQYLRSQPVASRCNTPTGALFLAFQGATEPTPWGAVCSAVPLLKQRLSLGSRFGGQAADPLSPADFLTPNCA